MKKITTFKFEIKVENYENETVISLVDEENASQMQNLYNANDFFSNVRAEKYNKDLLKIFQTLKIKTKICKDEVVNALENVKKNYSIKISKLEKELETKNEQVNILEIENAN